MPFSNYLNHAQSLAVLVATLEMASIQAGRSIGLGIFCALLGGLPLINWITRGLTGQQLSQIGTGNVSVSAAFYHGGRWVGILAVLSEAFKGVTAVLLARYCFPDNSAWEIVALIALVLGRYGIGRGAGTTNVVWGFFLHDWVSAALIFLLGGISFTILRERQLGRLGVLVLLPLITALRHPQNSDLLGATVFLSLLLAWIYQTIPDDLNLSTTSVQDSSQQMFRFFRGDRAILSLNQPLEATKVGQKAATLSQLRRWGYPVPLGWVLPPGDDPAPLMQWLQPTVAQPLAVRSSAIGEDSAEASAAGQYESILGVTSRQALENAILRCQASYSLPRAVQYRLDRGSDHQAMAVLIQIEVKGVFSGVAFSRDPISRQGEAIVVEALPGTAKQVVSGQVTPEQYRVWVEETDPASWILPPAVKPEIEGSGDVPPRLIEQVAYLSRHLEARYHGIPQDIEWSYDGQQLWLLQSRPVTTLLPIWTRKIAAEVIPGLIHPLTWSVNRPLTCGVWGEIFTLVLGKVRGLDFNQTATLHNSSAYFNASLLGEIFLRMGLPPESLEFLTRGAKFSRPPLQSTWQNLPGLLRLLGRELKLERDFARDQQRYFVPGLAALDRQPLHSSPQQLLDRIDQILELLRPATYYSIFAPLSLALRQAIFKVNVQDLDNGQTPEVASLRSLQALALKAKPLLSLDPLSLDPLNLNSSDLEPDAVWTKLSEHPSGQMIIRQFEDVLNRYGYLSDVGTDIAVPTWKEDPQPLRTLFVQFLLNPPIGSGSVLRRAKPQVQRRLDLKGQVGTVYGRLLAELRWSFVALEQLWLQTRQLSQPGDIFFLQIEEIRELVKAPTPDWVQRAQTLVVTRRSQREQDRQRSVPALVYGNEPPSMTFEPEMRPARQRFQGIGASPGRVEGEVRVLQNLQFVPSIGRETILVVPYTDSGWAPLLAQSGGLIAEVGGRLSHGAIVAREYGIPAVMDIHNATQLFKNGQRVRIDGQAGTVELL
jgi:phosphohistidine swiveling domain-containing protein/glycerol-3-phosphate acyltransferase PlsY